MQIGQVISGKYRLVRLLGDGGMGSVYEASHELLGTRVAIKVLHAELARRAGLIERFMQEARVAAQIQSPYVVRVSDIDRAPGGAAYIVMELLEGEPLSARLDRQGKLPLAAACELAAQVLEALEAAHALGVVHRDLKPENVIVTYQAGRAVAKLIDFGIAKLRTNVPGERSLTAAGVLMGTAEYMAPEQAYSADRVDGRADLYAVGVMLYEMIAGQRPVSGEDARVIAIKVERGEVTPLVHAAPEVPREIAGLVHRAMAPRPELRFATATEMRLALEGALSGKRPPTVALGHAPARGTMQVAPAPGAFVPSAAGGDAPPRTERAPAPLQFSPGTSLPGPNPGPSAAAGVTGLTPRKRGGGMWLLVVMPLLLGAGIVVAFVLTGITTETAPPAPAAAPVPPATVVPAPPLSIPTAPTGAASLAPLVPAGRPVPPAAHAGGPGRTPPSSASASASAATGAPDAAAPAAPPPFAFPSAFPFPLPADAGTIFPFPFPTAFPTELPTTLPFQLPPAEPPAPVPSASASSGAPPKML